MEIRKSKKYLKDYKKKIVNLHKIEEMQTIMNIENLFSISLNLNDVMNNSMHLIYGIEQKKGNLKEFYTADINSKLRLFLKPIGEYPYNKIEITSIDFVKIDDKHYGDG